MFALEMGEGVLGFKMGVCALEIVDGVLELEMGVVASETGEGVLELEMGVVASEIGASAPRGVLANPRAIRCEHERCKYSYVNHRL